MTPVPELNDLVDTVGDRCPTGSELDRLKAASEVAREVGRVGEDLVTHFVDEARAAGASWADIGDVLGVSRQGAHQRHHDRPRPDRWWRADFGRFTPQARQALKAAAGEARAAGNFFLGSEHILLGVLSVTDNVGNQALVRCGVDLAALEAATRAKLVPAGQDPSEAIAGPFGRGRGRGRGGPDSSEDGPGRGGRGGRGRGRGWDGLGPDGQALRGGPFPGGRGGPFGPDGPWGSDGPWGKGGPWGSGTPGDQPADADDPSDATDSSDAGGRGRGGRGFRFPFTASGRRVFDLATGASLDLGQSSLGCEHLVIGLARGEGTAALVLAEAGATPDVVLDAVRVITTETQA